MTLRGHITNYLTYKQRRGEMDRTTARDASYTLRSFAESFGHRPLDQLGAAAVERWMEQIGHLHPATRRQYLSRVRTFLQWMLHEGWIRKDPTFGVARIRQPRSVPRALATESIRDLLSVAPDPRARLIIWLMVGCGLRCVEISRLSVTDYDPYARLLRVTGKGGHQRNVPVPAAVRRAIDDYFAQTGVCAGPMVRSTLKPSRGITAKTISTYMRRWLYEAGVKRRSRDGRSAHALRHTAATDVLRVCGDLVLVQEMLGHARLDTTKIYTPGADVERMREAMEGRAYAA